MLTGKTQIASGGGYLMDYDFIIIGAGPGGYVAAIRAAQLGAKALIVEKEAFGGTCLNVGCIPTKAFYRSAQIFNYVKEAESFGIEISGECCVDMAKVLGRKDKIVNTLSSGVLQLMKQNKIEVANGCARFVDKNTVVVAIDGEEKTYTAKNIIIATGSKPSVPPIDGVILDGVITSNEALSLAEVPKSIVIIGGGVIGVEFAGILRSFGAEVTVVEFLPNILPVMDNEISTRLKLLLSKRGVKVMTNTKVLGIKKEGEGLAVSVEGKGGVVDINCEKVLISTGREINVDGLGLENIGVEYTKKGIAVDENYKTNVEGVYAIGDVTGRVMLAHVASDEGKACVEKILGHEAAVDYSLVPNNVFSFPEASSVGLTEEQAKASSIKYVVSKFPFSANGKALTMGEGDGTVKIIADAEKEKIIGVHIFGAHASDLIHEAVVAMKAGMTVKQLAETMHGHPTLPEALAEAAMGVFGAAVHLAPAKK